MAEREDSGDDRGVEGDSGIRDRVIGSPAFGQAVSAAVAARELAGDAQRAALGALNVSSQEQAERLERRIRVLSERLEEAEDRLDAALVTVRALEKRLADSVGDDSSAPDGSGESKD
jgi:hypothetical protein